MNDDVIVENVSKTFDLRLAHRIGPKISSQMSLENKLVAVDNISFSVQKGEMFGIIGMNGSGKTTLLRTIAGIYKPEKGRIKLNGRVAPLLQVGVGFQNELDAKENIVLSGMLYGMSKSEIRSKVESIIEFAELGEFTKMKLKNYSTGMQARLGFATALEINPDILLVDEILSVGDLAFREKSYKAFLSFRQQEKTILYSTHNLDVLPKLCNRVLLIHHGKMILIGNPDEVIVKYNEIIKQSQS